MSIKALMKNGTFVIVVIVLFVVAMPFMVGYIGEETGWFSLPTTKWVKGLFTSKPVGARVKQPEAADLKKELDALKEGLKLAESIPSVKIDILRPEVFLVERADPNPATASRFSWKLKLISDTLTMNAAQVQGKLTLICDPEDKVSGTIASVKPLPSGEKGFLVTVDNVRGEGKMGLLYDGKPPAVYYDVKLRRMWLVPVASCRSAMKDRYEAKVFFPGMEEGLAEGAVISPGSDKCGYRILSISDYCVWFEAFYGDEPKGDVLPHSSWPDFSRVDTMAPTPPPGRLIFGKSRCFWPGDAIRLPNSGSYLMVDDFLAGRAVVFRLLDAAMRPVRELLCVIVREKK